MIPYLGMETLKHHTLSGNTYLSSPHMGVPITPWVCNQHVHVLLTLEVSKNFKAFCEVTGRFVC